METTKEFHFGSPDKNAVKSCPLCGGSIFSGRGFEDEESGVSVDLLQCRECGMIFTLGGTSQIDLIEKFNRRK